MKIEPKDISIGVTVYRRLDYIEQALDSAVNQTVPVRVFLFDDGCPDQEGLQAILRRFGNRVEYRRNPKTLGLFENMNQCIWHCPTPWVSVLHDDDALAKDFVERVLEVAPEVKQCALFCGGTVYIDPSGRPFFRMNSHPDVRWRIIPPEEFAAKNQFGFPGQLIQVETARRLGGFPERSIYTGDWDLWFRLTLAGGTVQLGADLSFYRSHLGGDRGTTAASRSGRKAACCAMQAKRNFARLRKQGLSAAFDRTSWLENYGPLYRDLLIYAWRMPRRLLRYNRQLLLMTSPMSRASRALHCISRALGNPGMRMAGLARILGERLGFRMPQTF